MAILKLALLSIVAGFSLVFLAKFGGRLIEILFDALLDLSCYAKNEEIAAAIMIGLAFSMILFIFLFFMNN